MCREASSFKTFKNVLQTAVNKEQAFDVPFRFFFVYQKDGKSKKKKKGTTVGDELTPSIVHGSGRITQDNQHFLLRFYML